jgi:hypothetical protein
VPFKNRRAPCFPRFVNIPAPKIHGSRDTPRGQARDGVLRPSLRIHVAIKNQMATCSARASPRFVNVQVPKELGNLNTSRGLAGGKPPLRDRAGSETNPNLRTPRGYRGGRPPLRKRTGYQTAREPVHSPRFARASARAGWVGLGGDLPLRKPLPPKVRAAIASGNRPASPLKTRGRRNQNCSRNKGEQFCSLRFARAAPPRPSLRTHSGSQKTQEPECSARAGFPSPFGFGTGAGRGRGRGGELSRQPALAEHITLVL